ncbi:MAG TPA: RagB/SusD family nutrient uptake outer membrane protein [Cytophagales bacterium]|nr:RagB/SusD family nutrient uptake outer membrane protein [Cytophagales bacterium]
MKKIYLFIILLTSAMSCNVLDQEPQEEISDQTAFNNAKGAEAAMAGLYSQLQKTEYYGRNFQILSDCSSDISQSIGTWDFYREVDTYSIDASNLEIKNFYEIAYMGVNQANNIIANVPGIADLTDAKKDNFLGQAYFLRGLIFFDLVKMFGGVPGVAGNNGIGLPLTPSTKIDESSYISRASLADSYAQVRQDLETALTLLPASQANDGQSRARAVKGTARALLARYHLYMKEYDLAIGYATDVIDDSRYIINPSFKDIFDGKLTTESIFELEFNTADQSNIRTWYLPASLSGRGDIAAHGDLVNEMKANASDVRGTMFGQVLNTDNTVSHYYPTKYQKAGNIDNFHIIRIAEMYLIRAEARAIQGYAGAEDDLNMVRNRAGLADYSLAVDGDLILAIEKENKFEFAFEGHRWFDLVRTGRALTVLSSVNRKNSSTPISLSNPDYLVMPIPRDETLSNPNMKQNDGYGK